MSHPLRVFSSSAKTISIRHHSARNSTYRNLCRGLESHYLIDICITISPELVNSSMGSAISTSLSMTARVLTTFRSASSSNKACPSSSSARILISLSFSASKPRCRDALHCFSAVTRDKVCLVLGWSGAPGLITRLLRTGRGDHNGT